MSVRNLGYYQGQIINDPHRFKVAICGRRFGKTTMAAVRMFAKACEKPRGKIWYVTPTYKMAKEIMWEPLKELIPRRYVLRKNETELLIQLKNRCIIQLKGAEDPDKLRGPGLEDVTIDEFADVAERAWSEVLRPMLATTQGTALFIGTPRGYNWGYDMWLKGQQNDPRWVSWIFTTLQGGRVPSEELREARAELDPRVFRQEFLASFETLSGRVYGNFDRHEWPDGNLDPDIRDHGKELFIGLDFNINPMSAVVMQECLKLPQVLDAFQIATSDTEEMAQEIERRYPGRRIIICPDASGSARHTSSPMGQTDFTILRRHGFAILAEKSNPMIVDRINNVQSVLLNARGDRRLTIHPRAKVLIKALEGLTWKDGTNLVDKKSGLDHITDALGYVLWQKWNVLDRVAPRVAPVIGPMHSPFGLVTDNG